MISKIDRDFSFKKNLYYNKNYKNKKENKKSQAKKRAIAAIGLVALGAYAYMQIKKGKSAPLNNSSAKPYIKPPLALEDKSFGVRNFQNITTFPTSPIQPAQEKAVIGAFSKNNGQQEMFLPIVSKGRIFTDLNDEIVQNVELTKGMAFLENGEPFSGTFRTTTKRGDVVEILYKNGNLAKSSKNGKLFKEYETLRLSRDSFEGMYDNVFVRTINQYDEDGKNIIRQTMINKGENQLAKPKRIVVKDFIDNISFSKDFSANGQIATESIYESSSPHILKEQKCYENGKLVSITRKVEDYIYEKIDHETFQPTLYRADSTYSPISRETSIVEMKRIYGGMRDFVEKFKNFFK